MQFKTRDLLINVLPAATDFKVQNVGRCLLQTFICGYPGQNSAAELVPSTDQ